MSEAKLETLASRAGLAVDWIDANGRPQRVQPDALRAVLKGLGHPADTDAEIDASLHELEQAQQAKQLPPLLTVDSGHGLDLAHYFEPDTLCRVSLENGETLELRLDSNAVLPGVIALGYHQVHVNDQTFTLAVAPSHCYSVAEAVDSQPARAWGLSAQLYSLRRLGDGGFGDTLALEHLVRAAAERGADALAISPMHAMFSADTSRYSPYSPSSRLFLNSLYASPACILGEREVRNAIEAIGLVEALHTLEQGSLIDWAAAANAKQRLLRALYEDFRHGQHPQHGGGRLPELPPGRR